eukprot:150300_1
MPQILFNVIGHKIRLTVQHTTVIQCEYSSFFGASDVEYYRLCHQNTDVSLPFSHHSLHQYHKQTTPMTSQIPMRNTIRVTVSMRNTIRFFHFLVLFCFVVATTN